jgi:acetyltransferase-like isoleucine patch superfamily enzyme
VRSLIVNTLGASFWMPARARTVIWRLCGLRVPLGTLIFPGTIVRGRRLSVGRGTTFNYRCVIECREQVTIGERCGIGIGVLILTSSHVLDDPRVRAGVGTREPVRIGNGVSIASYTIVLPGVTIGDGVSTAAGAVILHDCEPHGLYAGVPAVRKRDLPH